MEYANGDKYEGDWYFNKKIGHSVYTYNDGKQFIGHYYENERNGFGVMKYPNGVVENCYYIKGKKYSSIINYSSGASYIGDYKNGIREGYGLYLYPSGDIYKGSFSNNKRNGYGCYIFHDGRIFEGYSVNGAFDGIGSYIWPDGSEYYGSFKNNVREGFGYYKHNQSMYFGFFENNQQNGNFIEIFPQGIYSGEFKNGLKDGIGALASGEYVYRGQFKNGYRTGYGVLLKNNECVAYGYWENDDLVRVEKIPSEYVYKVLEENKVVISQKYDEARYYGEMKDGTKHGYGCLFFEDGRVFIGYWENDSFIKGVALEEDGQKYIGEFKDDVATGNGMISSPVFNEKGDILDEFPNITIGKFYDSKPIGECVYYHYTGEMEKQNWYLNEKTSIVRINLDDNLLVANLKNGKLHGEIYSFLNDEKSITCEYYENGEFKKNIFHIK